MSNADVLRQGTEKAKKMIEEHIVNQILYPITVQLIEEAISDRRWSPNMTGNTINSYAGGIYNKGVLVKIVVDESIRPPVFSKLKDKPFEAGEQRWDEYEQENTYKGKIDTDGEYEPSGSIKFISSYKAPKNQWCIVICNGVEYAEFQESVMKLDVLTGNFDYAKMFVPSMFKPMSS